jgi:dienelactone hydrolase
MTHRPSLGLPVRVIASVLAVLSTGCRSALELTPSDAGSVLSRELLNAPDPGLPGSFTVQHLYYGSGTDRRRVVYRDSVAIRTHSVDASKLVDLGRSAKQRNRYWGFTPKTFPLNARVWYPEGAGPYPLVLIVHGNHDMKQYSDPGYAYLGRLLASRGYIAVSIDENFLNGAIRGENDARGWMLLKHLELWRAWERTPGNPFYHRVDMDHIALIGHSRGGEGVAVAAAFNRLDRYPDDATVPFDFGFAIRSVIAIAPVDGQYLPTGQQTPVYNVDYLLFHGSHDGDVSSFHGLRQWHRVHFTDGKEHFKAAIYVYRANHGQWNTVWDAHDDGPRSGRILDLRGLLPPEQQRRFAEVYIGGFLDATLKGDRRYLPMFRDYRVVGRWLPSTMYVSRFEDSSFRPLADYEEDIDVSRGTAPGVRLVGDSLGIWREGTLELRSRNRNDTSASQDNQAVWLGWNNHVAGDTARRATPGSYTVTLPDTLARAWNVDTTASLEFMVTPTEDAPPPPHKPAGPKGDSTTNSGAQGSGKSAKPGEYVDFTVELRDAAGDSVRVPASAYGVIRRPLEMHVMRRMDMDRRFFPHDYELVMQSIDIPFADLVHRNPAFRPDELRTIRFVFDRTRAAVIVLDNIGIAHLDAAFRAAELPAHVAFRRRISATPGR